MNRSEQFGAPRSGTALGGVVDIVKKFDQIVFFGCKHVSKRG